MHAFETTTVPAIFEPIDHPQRLQATARLLHGGHETPAQGELLEPRRGQFLATCGRKNAVVRGTRRVSQAAVVLTPSRYAVVVKFSV